MGWRWMRLGSGQEAALIVLMGQPQERPGTYHEEWLRLKYDCRNMGARAAPHCKGLPQFSPAHEENVWSLSRRTQVSEFSYTGWTQPVGATAFPHPHLLVRSDNNKTIPVYRGLVLALPPSQVKSEIQALRPVYRGIQCKQEGHSTQWQGR